MQVPFPDLEEQGAIVRFLDHIERRIRRYTRAKQKLIKLLEEQKQAVIHQAVTRGLDPTVRMKPSGVEWLGEVPEHWATTRIKMCSRTISKGTTPSTEGRAVSEAGPVRFIKAENIAAGLISPSPAFFIDEETHNLLGRSQLQSGDVLFVIAGATLGKTAIVGDAVLPANTNQAVAFIRPKPTLVPEYLAFWLQSGRVRELTWLHAVQSAQPNLAMGSLGDFPFPFPPFDEQRAIVAWLTSELQSTEALSDAARRDIALQKELRVRIIADVVTGKLDVRAAAAALPDEPDDSADLPVDDDVAEDDDLDSPTEETDE